MVVRALRETRPACAVVLLVAMLAATGCANEERAPEREVGPNVVQPGAPGEPARTLSADELESLEPPSHTEADIRFMQGMIHHHAQALWLAQLAPRRGASDDVELVAKRLELSQAAEIELMQQWLEQRGADAPTLDRQEGHASGPRESERMPGMLTDVQLRRLAAARGRAFDRLFLESMIGHHEGALTMVQRLYAQNGGQEPEGGAFARHVESDQQVEILRMRELLQRLAAAGAG